MLRDSGQYWPSVCHYLGGGATAVHFNQESRKVFVGLDTGIVAEFEVRITYTTIWIQLCLDFQYCYIIVLQYDFQLSEDCNRLDHIKDYHAHTQRVTGIHYSHSKKWLLSCAKDKYLQFHCAGTGRRLGGYLCNAAW